jgi:hypothetical protein
MSLKKVNTLVLIIFITVAILITVSQSTFANVTNQSAVKYRIQPLREKLTVFTNVDVTDSLKRFSDLSNHWSREYVGKLKLLEIVDGYSDGRFGPEDTLKVDEFLKMVVKAMGYKIEEGMCYWAELYIKLAKREEIIKEDEFIDYRRPILREEAARVIIKATLKIEEAPIPNHISYAKQRIPDYHDIGDEYKQYVLYSYSIGLITGANDERFSPKKTLTRGEGSAIIMRYLDDSMRKPTKPKDTEIVKFYDDNENKIYEIYPPSKTEVIDVIRVMSDSAKKSKGYSKLAYNTTDEVISLTFYKNKEACKEGSTFSDGSFSIKMAEWELNGYDFTIFDAKAAKELHKDVLVDLLNHLLENEAERAIKDLDHIIDLVIRGEGIVYEEKYWLNNREVAISKHNSDRGFGIYVSIKVK